MMLVEAIARYLDGLSVLTFDPTGADGDTFLTVVPPTPEDIVVLSPTGGFAPDPLDATDQPSFQVRTRASRDPRDAYERQLAIYDKLHGLTDVTLADGTHLSGCLAIQSDPVFIGLDENGRPEYTVNYRTYVRRETSHRE